MHMSKRIHRLEPDDLALPIRSPQVAGPTKIEQPEIRGQIESSINSLRDALKSEDGDRIKKSMDNLNQVSHKLAEQVYKAARGLHGRGLVRRAQATGTRNAYWHSANEEQEAS